MKKLLLPLGILFLVFSCAFVFGALQFVINPTVNPNAWIGLMQDTNQIIQQNATSRLDNFLLSMICLKSCPGSFLIFASVAVVAWYIRRWADRE